MTLEEAYYERTFENEFLRSKADQFQTFFDRLMGLAHKGDYMASRPWGNRGDRKNDGFLKSQRRLFGVYAPNEMSEAKVIAKITEDLEGAKVHWREHFDSWTFVHNSADGLPPHVQRLLLDFEAANPGITIDPWSLEELRVVFRGLTREDKQCWFGPAPNEETKARLGFEDLRVVLVAIGNRSPEPGQEVRDVPQGKIEANALSESTATLLKQGMTKAYLVEQFFGQWHEETFGERLAAAFHAKYVQLRPDHIPNEVFRELQTWAGGPERGTPEHELAVLTVLAYFFERCEIFEEPKVSPP